MTKEKKTLLTTNTTDEIELNNSYELDYNELKKENEFLKDENAKLKFFKAENENLKNIIFNIINLLEHNNSNKELSDNIKSLFETQDDYNKYSIEYLL